MSITRVNRLGVGVGGATRAGLNTVVRNRCRGELDVGSEYDTVAASPHVNTADATMTPMSYATVTVPNRPLLSVGTWNASTGEEVITHEDLAEIIAAAQSGVLDYAVIKKGHQDPRYAEFNEDGSPAFGQVTNLRVVDGTLMGDYINVPTSLAESLASAYPHVSVELARNVKLRDAEGNVAHAFGCVLTAAALLGATPPAVKGLSQKAYLFAEDAYDYTTLMPEATTELASKKKADPAPETTPEPAPTPEQTTAEAAPEPSDGPGGDNPTPTPTTEDAPGSADDTADVPPQGTEIADASREAPAPRTAPASPSAESEGVPPMPSIDDKAAELRKQYDLPENASYKDLLAKVLEAQEQPEIVAPGTDETPVEEIAEQIAEETERRQKYNLSEGESKPKDQQVKAEVASLDDVYLSKSAFSQFQAEFEATKAELAERKAAETKERRDRLVATWFKQGLIGKDEREGVRSDLEEAEGVVIRNVTRRTPMFGIEESGHAIADESHFALGTDDTKAEKIAAMDDAVFGA